ncbi:6-hydroxymethylpterin diphosphokinase MptE-like protein [Gallaecimonas sp. GXIMD4217]|uniref:motility associated factor glycosyltransferase family protein n=1 Tax=Gallaecimonas sp. GXIMD4217 TaxID=3131927 RepID=UPI00311B2D7A
MSELEHDIHAKIAELEKIQQKLQKRVESEKFVETEVAGLALPDIDYEARFANNMAALEQYLPDVAQALAGYQPRQFEIVVAPGDVNLVNNQDDGLVYPQNAYQQILAQYLRFCASPITTYFDWQADPDNHCNFVHVEYLNKMLALSGERLDRQQAKEHLPEVINSLIVFGIGLGFDMEKLVQERDIRRLFLYEPNPDFFYASLHVVDWAALLKRLDELDARFHLCLGADADDFFQALSRQMIVDGQYEASFSYCYVHYLDANMAHAIEVFKKKCYELMFGYGFFDDALMSLAHQYHNIRAGTPFLSRRKDPQALPVIIVGNGPSLDKAWSQLRAWQDRAVIISCGTALKALHRHGIRPDFHVEMERTAVTRDVLNAIGDDDYLAGLRLLTLNTVHPEVPAKFGRVLMAKKFNEAASVLLDGYPAISTLNFCNPTVSNCALAFAEALGFRDVVLVGVDMGFPGEQHHAQGSIYFDQEGDDKALFDINAQKAVKVPANFGGEVYTSAIFNYSRMSIEELLKLAPDLNCYNTAEGAFIDGATPIAVDKVALPPVALDKDAYCDALMEAASIQAPEALPARMEVIGSGQEFAQLVDRLVELVAGPVQSRSQALALLQQQFDELVGHQGETAYLADMLRGTLLYCHSSLVKLLLMPQTPEEGLANFEDGRAILIAYLKATKAKLLAQGLAPDASQLGHIWR